MDWEFLVGEEFGIAAVACKLDVEAFGMQHCCKAERTADMCKRHSLCNEKNFALTHRRYKTIWCFDDLGYRTRANRKQVQAEAGMKDSPDSTPTFPSSTRLSQDQMYESPWQVLPRAPR